MPKILYVEDNPDIAELVRRQVDRAGHRFAHARGDAKAFRQIADDPPDLILLDIDLGTFSDDGWSINRRLKADPTTAAIPVIALTAHAQQVEHRERALAEGFVEHVAKPIDNEELLTKIHRFIGRATAPATG